MVPKGSNPLLAYKPYGVLQVNQWVINRRWAQIFILGIARRGLRLSVLGSCMYRRKSRIRLLLLDFLAFVSFIPHRHFLNSTPQFLARDRDALAAGRGAGPGDLRMDAAAEAAVDADHSVFSRCSFYPLRHGRRRLVSKPVAGYGPFVRNNAEIHQANI